MLQRQFVLCVCINLAGLFCISAHTHFNDRIRTLPAYMIASKAVLLNSTTCGKELQIFRNAVNQRILWSLKVLDSSGDFQSGFLYGHNFWLGSHNQCLDTMNTIPLPISQQQILNNTLYRDPRKEFPPFQINYFVAQFTHNSTLQYHTNTFEENVIMLGLCLPASCTTNNLSFILEEIFRDRAILINDLYSADFQLIQVKNLNDDNKLPSGVLRFVCVSLGLSFLLIVIGTIYDVFVHQRDIKKNETNETGKENMSERIQMTINLSSHQESKIGKILMCFSGYTNTKKIFNLKLDADTIPVIHGIKFLCMCIIVFGHTIFFAADYFDNKIWVWRAYKNITAVIDIGLLTPDTFFLLSGCLVTYNYLRRKTNEKLIKSINYREKLIEFFSHVIKRFNQLTPTYMVVLVITYLSSSWFESTSPFYVNEKSFETCPKYWWRNLLYINNFFGLKAMCMSWSWHLACEMQFFVIAMMLLILSTSHFSAAVTIMSALLISSSIISGYISYVYEYVSTLDDLHRLSDVLYFLPWVRINPYIIGMMLGYILIKLNNNLILKKKIIIFCWCLVIVYKVFIAFASYNQNRSVLFISIYVALCRTLWAISISWIIIACSTKHGGIVDKLLSFKGWIPLSRLTYGAYLSNPIIIRAIYSSCEQATHFEFTSLFVITIAIMVLSFFCAYVLSLVTMPIISLTKILFQSKVYKKEL